MARERALSLIQPTGKGQLHIGNYFGAIRNWVKLQEHYDCIFGAVDYHAITVEFDPKNLQQQSLDIITDLIACGIDPQRSTVMVQSHVPEHTELCWIFNCIAAYGDVQRMTQFKDKAEQQAYVTVGLFDYPVLQAADILIYKAKAVPVGQDQDQHLELTRGIAQKFNNRFGEVFPIPYTGRKLRQKHDLRGAKIVSPADPDKKMSKSLGDKHCLFLMEDEKKLHKKIRSAVTDMGPADVSGEKSPGVANLFHLLELTAPQSVVDEFESEYRNETLKYVKLKDAVYEHLMAELRPVRERKKELESDPETIRGIVREGSAKARQMASETLQEVRRLLGVGPL
ncbi:MAG TPA: tryptophan--tRNA ligase [Acidobacteriota bacterium]|nr:tryptophan--tRNA ligase [Acidobacteriota bacterium]